MARYTGPHRRQGALDAPADLVDLGKKLLGELEQQRRLGAPPSLVLRRTTPSGTVEARFVYNQPQVRYQVRGGGGRTRYFQTYGFYLTQLPNAGTLDVVTGNDVTYWVQAIKLHTYRLDGTALVPIRFSGKIIGQVEVAHDAFHIGVRRDARRIAVNDLYASKADHRVVEAAFNGFALERVRREPIPGGSYGPTANGYCGGRGVAIVYLPFDVGARAYIGFFDDGEAVQWTPTGLSEAWVMDADFLATEGRHAIVSITDTGPHPDALYFEVYNAATGELVLRQANPTPFRWLHHGVLHGDSLFVSGSMTVRTSSGHLNGVARYQLTRDAAGTITGLTLASVSRGGDPGHLSVGNGVLYVDDHTNNAVRRYRLDGFDDIGDIATSTGDPLFPEGVTIHGYGDMSVLDSFDTAASPCGRYFYVAGLFASAPILRVCAFNGDAPIDIPLPGGQPTDLKVATVEIAPLTPAQGS